MAKVIAFSNNKGGVLKTSLSVNLAGVLSKAGKDVLIVDLDSQGNSYTTFGKDPDDIEWTIYDLLTNNPKLNNPHDAVLNLAENLDIIVANDDMSYFEIEVLLAKDTYDDIFALFKDSIESFKEEYDYIIVDTPPALGLIAANVFIAVDEVVIPFQPEPYAFRSLVKTVTAVNNFKDKNPDLKVKSVIPVKYRHTVMHRAFIDSAKAFAKTQHIKFSDIVIKESIKYAETTLRENVPVTLLEEVPETLKPYAEVYQELAKELEYIG